MSIFIVNELILFYSYLNPITLMLFFSLKIFALMLIFLTNTIQYIHLFSIYFIILINRFSIHNSACFIILLFAINLFFYSKISFAS